MENLNQMVSPSRCSGSSGSKVDRVRELQNVFHCFDLDGSGTIEPAELMILGQRRTELGHKTRIWTPEKNRRMVDNMDLDVDGVIDESEFVKHYLSGLSGESDATFMKTITEFLELVRAVEEPKTRESVSSDDLGITPEMGLWSVLAVLMSRGGLVGCYRGCKEQITLTVLKQGLNMTLKECPFDPKFLLESWP